MIKMIQLIQNIKENIKYLIKRKIIMKSRMKIAIENKNDTSYGYGYGHNRRTYRKEEKNNDKNKEFIFSPKVKRFRKEK